MGKLNECLGLLMSGNLLHSFLISTDERNCLGGGGGMLSITRKQSLSVLHDSAEQVGVFEGLSELYVSVLVFDTIFSFCSFVSMISEIK